MITRKEVKELIKNTICTLSEEEIEALKETPEILIGEKFALMGTSWKEAEQWLSMCYKMDLNPLPTLRKALNGVIDVGFMYESNMGWISDKDALVCVLNGETKEVSLEYKKGGNK